MARKIDVKKVLELLDSGLSIREIASTRHISRNSVTQVKSRAAELNIHYAQIQDKSDDAVYTMFYPHKYITESDTYELPNYEQVHIELKRVGVTLKLLWEEYCAHCRSNNKIPVKYSKYCKDYGEYTCNKDITNHILHKPGVRCEVDWSGPTMSYISADNSKITVYLFVATLPYSQYTYVEPVLDMKQSTWLRCNINMYEFFKGVPIRTICDNLKTGVTSHPKEGEIVLNPDYEALGNHYHTAIMPTGVRKPKQKASVEGNVGNIATAIIAKLRNEKYESFAMLKAGVVKALKVFNQTPFQKRPYSRFECWQDEQQYLQPLPNSRYEITEWTYNVKVGKDCHITYKKNHYSCPYTYVGMYVDVKTSDTLLQIYYSSELICAHPLFPRYQTNKFSTHEEDLPDEFHQPEFDDVRIKSWARSVGPNTDEVIKKIFKSVGFKEQGYNSTLAVLRLSKAYGNDLLELASSKALELVAVPRYRTIKAILDELQATSNVNGLELSKEDTHSTTSAPKGHIRGADYYKEHH